MLNVLYYKDVLLHLVRFCSMQKKVFLPMKSSSTPQFCASCIQQYNSTGTKKKWKAGSADRMNIRWQILEYAVQGHNIKIQCTVDTAQVLTNEINTVVKRLKKQQCCLLTTREHHCTFSKQKRIKSVITCPQCAVCCMLSYTT